MFRWLRGFGLLAIALSLPHYVHGTVEIPEFTEEPTSQYVRLGSPVSLVCRARPASTQIWWLFGGRRIRTDPQRGYRIDNGVLIIESFQKRGGLSHAGVYRCVANNSYGAVISQQAILDKAAIRQFEDEDSAVDIHVNATEGNVALIPCNPPRGQPQVLTRFTVNGTTIDHENRRRHYLLPSGSLQIGSVRRSDQGLYHCLAYNPVTGQERPAPASVHLHVLLPVSNSVTRFVQKPEEELKVHRGANVTLECVTEGAPVPVVIWEKFGGELPQDRHQQILGNLELYDVRNLDAGTYICRANNQQTEQTAITELAILGVPSVRVVATYEQVKEGGTTRLRCRVPPKMSIHVEWWYNAQLLRNDDPNIILDDTEVTITNARLENTGIYQCVANTKFSTSTSAAYIEIVSEIDEENGGTDVEISVDPDNDSDEIEIESVERNEAQNEHTDSNTAKRPVLVPPSKPSVKKLSDHSVMLSWSVGDNIGLNITFFKVQYKSKQSDRQRWVTLEEDIPRDARRYEVSNLIPGGTYRFRVVAVYSNNDNQQGPNSDRYVLEPGEQLDLEAPVDRPFLVKVEPISSTMLQLEWQYDDGSPIEGFVLKYRPYYSSDLQLQEHYLPDASARKFKLGSLQPDTEYTVFMHSFNAAGQGPASNDVARKTQVDDSDSNVGVITVPSPWGPPVNGDPGKTDAGMKGVYTPSTGRPSMSTESSSQLLYLVLGVVLGVMMLLLVIFMVMCGWRQRQHRRMLAAIDQRNKFHDPSRAIYADSLHKTQMNGGGMFLLNGLNKANGGPNGTIPNGNANGFTQTDRDKVNINVNPISEMEMQGMRHDTEDAQQETPEGSYQNVQEIFHAPPPPPVCCCSERDSNCNSMAHHPCGNERHVCDSNASSRDNISQADHCCCHSPRNSCCESQTNYCPPGYNSFSTFNKGCPDNQVPNGGPGPGYYSQQQPPPPAQHAGAPGGRTFSPDHIPRSFERPYRSQQPHSAGSSDGVPSGSHEPYEHLSEHSHSSSSQQSGRPHRHHQPHNSSGNDTPTKDQATNTDDSNEDPLGVDQQSLPYSPSEDRSPDDLPPPPFIPPPPHLSYHQQHSYPQDHHQPHHQPHHLPHHQPHHQPHYQPLQSRPLLPRSHDYSPSDNEADETDSFLG